jgi:putative oxidoreductase
VTQTTLKNMVPHFARVLMALLFLVAGLRKLMGFSATALYFAKLGLPVPEVAAALVIVLELGGAILLISGWRLKIVASALAIFTLGAALLAHRFWQADPAQLSNQLNHFLKNIAIVGGFLMVAWYSPEKLEKRRVS